MTIRGEDFAPAAKGYSGEWQDWDFFTAGGGGGRW